MDRHGQTYIPPPSAEDIKVCETRILNLEVQEAAQNDLVQRPIFCQKINVIPFKEVYAHFHYVRNMCTKFKTFPRKWMDV